jgi:hypothetical protein
MLFVFIKNNQTGECTMAQTDVSRREFIRKAGLGLAAATIGLAGCTPKEIVKTVPVEVTREVTKEVTRQVTQEASQEVPQKVPQEVPSSPWSYVALDVETVRKKGHTKFYEGDCCYGAFASIIEALQEKAGFPFTQIPTKMMEFGAGGVAGWGTTCGALIGASAAINLVTDKATAKKLVSELLGWYTQTPFPSQISNQYAVQHQYYEREYKSDKELPQSVSNSPLCHVSVTKWCLASKMASGSKEREERCSRLAGDVAAKAVEMLNANLMGSFTAAFKPSSETQVCTTCHTKGENYDAGQFTLGMMECTSCHEPHALK